MSLSVCGPFFGAYAVKALGCKKDRYSLFFRKSMLK